LFAWVAGQFTFLRGLEFLTLPLLGAAFGLLYETRRTGRANLAYGEETHRALEGLGAEYAKATTGLLDLYYRQQEWNHVVEERSVERQRALDATLERVQRLAESRNTTLLSLSHDMRSPLAVVKANNGMLREFISGEPDALEAVEDNQQAIEKVETILREILTLSKNDGGLFDVRPERIEIGPLLETIRGILQALVIRRDIRVSVFASRHCPQSFETDPFLLGRVIDNILTNAAKYTDRGSIVVEVDGAPRGLCFKVSDSGRGIARDKLESVFTAQAADPSPYVGDSHGLGLPIVIRLLDQLGGKLEVVSKLEVGTTFWVYLPLTAPRSGHQMPELGDGPESLEDIRERVVVIRRSGGDPVR
ncbi:MAG: HAMP domain-containing sensor histidine kinase, partial [Candidatus Limnocylindrales bacterium]